jgi:hypothetical protein
MSYENRIFFIFGWAATRIIPIFVSSLHHTFSLNTFRLWVVQLFAIIKEYQVEYAHDAAALDDANLCTMIAFKVNKTEYMMETRHENFNSACEPVSFYPLMPQLLNLHALHNGL